jgi:hypothetical protein
MHSIAKFCADYLRAFSNNHGVKLKSGHAHELVAAFFGYKSKAAMQADTLCSIENIGKAEIFVLTPSMFIDDRRKCLEDLPSELPDTYTLGESMLVFLASENRLSGRSFASWAHLAEVLTTEYLQKHGDLILPLNFRPYEKARNIFNKPLYEFKPKIEITDNEVKLTVTNRYYGSQNVNFQAIDVRLAINLQRIAGYVGYKNAEICLIDSSNQLFSQSGAVL